MLKLSFMLALTLVGAAAYSQQSPSTADYFIRITDPATDQVNVGRDHVLRGTSRIPAGMYLYAFCHKAGLALWWPQGPVQFRQGSDEWTAIISFGEGRDIGSDFEIKLIEVDKPTRDRLNAAIIPNTGVVMPDSRYSALRVVHKTSHPN
jgi:hypothetical protein